MEKQDQSDRPLLSVHAAARCLGISPRQIRAAVEAGEIPGFRPGARVTYIRVVDLAAWLEQRRVEATVGVKS